MPALQPFRRLSGWHGLDAAADRPALGDPVVWAHRENQVGQSAPGQCQLACGGDRVHAYGMGAAGTPSCVVRVIPPK